MADEKNPLLIGTIISAKDERPYLQFRLGESVILQLTPDDAREFASQIFAAAEASVGDAFIYHFLKSSGDMVKLKEALEAFRKYREALANDDPAI